MGLMMAADKIIASLFIGVNALVATNLIGPMQMMIYAVSTLFMSGLGSYIGLLIGQKKISKANSASSLVLAILSIFMVIVTAGVLVFSKEIAYFVGARGSVFKLTKDYLYFVSLGFIPMVLASAMDILIMNDEHPSFVMKVNIGSTLLNLGLNILFVAVFNLHIVGLATATTISHLIHFIISANYFKSHCKTLKLVKPKFDISILKRIIYNGTSDFLGMFSEGLKRYVINIAIITFLTAKHMEAYSIVSMFIIIFISSVYYGTALGLQPIFSKMMGAMAFPRLVPLLKYSVKFSHVIALVVFLIAMPLMPTILGFFISDPVTIQIGFYIYLTFGFATLFENLPNAIIMFFTAINRPLESIVFSVVRTIILLPVLSYFAIAHLGQSGLMIGTLLAELIVIAATVIYMKSIDFTHMQVVE